MSIRSSATLLSERFKSTTIYNASRVYVKNAIEFPLKLHFNSYYINITNILETKIYNICT